MNLIPENINNIIYYLEIEDIANLQYVNKLFNEQCEPYITTYRLLTFRHSKHKHVEIYTLSWYTSHHITHIINFYCNNTFEVLTWLSKKYKHIITNNSKSIMDKASNDNRIDILDLCHNNLKNKGILLNCSMIAINTASDNGHSNVLEWWSNSSINVHCSIYAISTALKNNHPNVLKTWYQISLKHNIDLNHIARDVDCKELNNSIESLNVWLDICQKHKIQFEIPNLIFASENNHLNMLNWWSNIASKNNIKIEYDILCIELASKNGHTDILNWWFNHFQKLNIVLEITEKCIDLASSNDHINVLEWWIKNTLSLKYTFGSINSAYINGHINILYWWLNPATEHKLELKYSKFIFTLQPKNNHQLIDNWLTKLNIKS